MPTCAGLCIHSLSTYLWSHVNCTYFLCAHLCWTVYTQPVYLSVISCKLYLFSLPTSAGLCIHSLSTCLWSNVNCSYFPCAHLCWTVYTQPVYLSVISCKLFLFSLCSPLRWTVYSTGPIYLLPVCLWSWLIVSCIPSTYIRGSRLTSNSHRLRGQLHWEIPKLIFLKRFLIFLAVVLKLSSENLTNLHVRREILASPKISDKMPQKEIKIKIFLESA